MGRERCKVAAKRHQTLEALLACLELIFAAALRKSCHRITYTFQQIPVNFSIFWPAWRVSIIAWMKWSRFHNQCGPLLCPWRFLAHQAQILPPKQRDWCPKKTTLRECALWSLKRRDVQLPSHSFQDCVLQSLRKKHQCQWLSIPRNATSELTVQTNLYSEKCFKKKTALSQILWPGDPQRQFPFSTLIQETEKPSLVTTHDKRGTPSQYSMPAFTQVFSSTRTIAFVHQLHLQTNKFDKNFLTHQNLMLTKGHLLDQTAPLVSR